MDIESPKPDPVYTFKIKQKGRTYAATGVFGGTPKYLRVQEVFPLTPVCHQYWNNEIEYNFKWLEFEQCKDFDFDQVFIMSDGVYSSPCIFVHFGGRDTKKPGFNNSWVDIPGTIYYDLTIRSRRTEI